MNEAKGSITVFLSLTGILILALLGTMVETARYKACAGHAIRTIRASTEALLAEYSRPLYDHYGLFFLEGSGKAYEKVIAGYAADTMEAAGAGTMDFLKGAISQIKVMEKVYPGDQKAALLQKEIREYMLRRVAREQLEQWMNQTKQMSETEEEAVDIEKTVEEQEELAELDEQLLDLMKWIDGITVEDGKVSCANTFVKMFAVSKVKSKNFGVTEPVVWEKMKPKIDRTPLDWSSLDTKVFLEKVKTVEKLADKAIVKAEELKKAYDKCAGRKTEFAEHDQRMGVLIQQMSVLRGNRDILTKSQEILEGEVTEDTSSVLEELWKNYDTDHIVFDYTGVEECGGARNPLDVLAESWGDGILNLVCREEISEKSVPQADHFATLYEEEESGGEDYGERVTDLAEEEKVSLSGVGGNLAGYSMDEFCLDSYITDQFSGFTKKVSGWTTSLEYQWEYMVAGKDTDKKNLESVLNRILMIRVPVNFIALYSDSSKKAEAYAAAAAVVGFTGMEPLIRLVQTLILLVWAMVEGMVDVAGLLQGRKVPVVKKSSQVLTVFSDLFVISQKAITGRAEKFAKADKKSFGYQEYLMMFLALTEQVVRRYRVMDVIQWDMVKNGYKNFQLETCVASMRVSADVSFPACFFRFPVLRERLGRDIKTYFYHCEIMCGYL